MFIRWKSVHIAKVITKFGFAHIVIMSITTITMPRDSRWSRRTRLTHSSHRRQPTMANTHSETLMCQVSTFSARPHSCGGLAKSRHHQRSRLSFGACWQTPDRDVWHEWLITLAALPRLGDGWKLSKHFRYLRATCQQPRLAQLSILARAGCSYEQLIGTR